MNKESREKLLAEIASVLMIENIPFLFVIQQEDDSLHLQYHFPENAVSELRSAAFEFGFSPSEDEILE